VRPASLFLASGLILAIGCGPTPEATTETTVGAVRTLPETTATQTVPPFEPPAGLVEAVTITITGDDRDREDVATVVNDEEIGLFTSVASCSLVEGGSWFPLEVVVADESFIRLSSIAPTPEGLGAIEGQLTYHDLNSAPVDALVTVYVGDDSTSGSFAGQDDQGRAVSGAFDCRSSVRSDEMSPDGNIELSVRLRDANDMGGQRVRRLGFRTSSDQSCPTDSEGSSNRWQVEGADYPVGGLVAAVLDFNAASGAWSGEFVIAFQTVVVQELTVSMMSTGLVFSGVSVDNVGVDGALTC
jgi:hypothetical protein